MPRLNWRMMRGGRDSEAALATANLDGRVVEAHAGGDVHTVDAVLDELLREDAALYYRVAAEDKFFGADAREERVIRADDGAHLL